MGERFEVVKLDPNNQSVLSNLLDGLLVKKRMRLGNPRVDPLNSVIEHVHRLGAACALVQRDVQDPDFLAEHAAYYSKWSAKTPRYCTRVHFFRGEPSSDDPLEVIDEMAAVSESYLGFTTLRPIAVSPVAATILRPFASELNYFITSRDQFPVNLAGQRFEVDGTPFLQQDNAVGACAQASIWMALRTLRRKEGQAAFSTAQITTAATRFLVQGRTLPNREGIGSAQIAEAVRAAGYSPHLIALGGPGLGNSPGRQLEPSEIVEARRKLYPYVESGIPVVLGIVPPNGIGHAVLIVGHKWFSPTSRDQLTPVMSTSDPQPAYVYDASDWARPFIIHNDNMGPYLELPESGTGAPYELAQAIFAVPFLPADVFISGEEALQTCLLALRHALQVIPPDFVARTYLQDRAEFRQSVLQSGMPDEVIRYYRKKWLPKRVWVMEINALDGYEESPGQGGTRLGEVVLDSASEPADGHFLSIHLTPTLVAHKPGLSSSQGIILDREAFEGHTEAIPIEGDHSYAPRLR